MNELLTQENQTELIKYDKILKCANEKKKCELFIEITEKIKNSRHLNNLHWIELGAYLMEVRKYKLYEINGYTSFSQYVTDIGFDAGKVSKIKKVSEEFMMIPLTHNKVSAQLSKNEMEIALEKFYQEIGANEREIKKTEEKYPDIETRLYKAEIMLHRNKIVELGFEKLYLIINKYEKYHKDGDTEAMRKLISIAQEINESNSYLNIKKRIKEEIDNQDIDEFEDFDPKLNFKFRNMKQVGLIYRMIYMIKSNPKLLKTLLKNEIDKENFEMLEQNVNDKYLTDINKQIGNK